MYILIAGHSGDRVDSAAGHGDLMKRQVRVGTTLSTVIALVYLALWLIGVGLCVFYCRGCPSGRALRPRFPWRGEKKTGKKPERNTSTSDKSHSQSQRSLRAAPEAGPSSSSHAEHKSASRKEYMRANPWVDGFERIHTRPQKGTSGVSADNVNIIPGPPGHMSLSRIDEESMSNRMSSAGSKAIPRDRKPKLEVDVATANTIVTETKSTLNHSSDAGPSLRRDRSNGAFPSWGNVPREAYAWSRHTPPAAINTPSPQLESPLNGTEESGASRQTITPSLDEFPFPLPSSDSHYRDSASFFTTTPDFSEFPSTVANGHSPPGYQTNNTTYAVRHPQGQTGAAVPMLPLYSSRTVSHQTRARALSNSATSDETLETIGTVTSQPAVVAVQQARRVSFLGPAHAVAVPSDAGHFDMPRAV